jgi:hypothetical protein
MSWINENLLRQTCAKLLERNVKITLSSIKAEIMILVSDTIDTKMPERFTEIPDEKWPMIKKQIMTRWRAELDESLFYLGEFPKEDKL